VGPGGEGRERPARRIAQLEQVDAEGGGLGTGDAQIAHSGLN
jgi:hypothetical protein